MVFFLKFLLIVFYFINDIFEYGIFLLPILTLYSSYTSIIFSILFIGLIFSLVMKSLYLAKKYLVKENLQMYFLEEGKNKKGYIKNLYIFELLLYTTGLILLLNNSIFYILEIASIYNKNIVSIKTFLVVIVFIFLIYLIIGDQRQIFYCTLVIKACLIFFIFFVLLSSINSLHFPKNFFIEKFSIIQSIPYIVLTFLGRETTFFVAPIDQDYENKHEKYCYYRESFYGYIFLIFFYIVLISLSHFFLFTEFRNISRNYFQVLIENNTTKKLIVHVINIFMILITIIFSYKTILKIMKNIKIIIGLKTEKKYEIPENFLLMLIFLIMIIVRKIPILEAKKLFSGVLFILISLFLYISNIFFIKKSGKGFSSILFLSLFFLKVLVLIIFSLLLIMS